MALFRKLINRGQKSTSPAINNNNISNHFGGDCGGNCDASLIDNFHNSSLNNDRRGGSGGNRRKSTAEKFFNYSFRNNSRNNLNNGVTANNYIYGVDKNDLCEHIPFELPDLRLVIFRENEWKERRLLFDSDSLQRQSTNHKTSPTKTAHTPLLSPWDLSPQSPSGSLSPGSEEESFSTRVKSDSKLLGEMMFGSMTMSYKGDTTKLHQFNSPPKLMMTKVFNVTHMRRKSCQPAINELGTYEDNAPSSSTGCRSVVTPSASSNLLSTTANNNESDSDKDSQYSTVNSLENYLTGNRKLSRSIPLDVPPANRNCTSANSNNSNSNICRQITTPSPDGSDLTRSSSRDFANCAATPSTPVASSWKRYQLNQFMNLQSGIHRRSCHNISDDDDFSSVNFCIRKRIQLGLGVLFSFGEDDESLSENATCFRRFLFSHMQIIESEILKLQREILRACHSKRQFSLCALQAWCSFRASLKALFESTRLKNPVWLSLMNSSGITDKDESNKFTDHKIETNFVTALTTLSDMCDRKETKFFLSSLLTAFLTSHSSWISSVAPSVPSSSSSNSKRGQQFHCHRRFPQWGRNSEAGCHPTNPFWAQLLEVWGVLHHGQRSLRTLILGKDGDLLLRLMFVISYFLRCSSLTIKNRRRLLTCLPVLRNNSSASRQHKTSEDSAVDNNGCLCSQKFEDDLNCTCENDRQNSDSTEMKFMLNENNEEEGDSYSCLSYRKLFSNAHVESLENLFERTGSSCSLSSCDVADSTNEKFAYVNNNNNSKIYVEEETTDFSCLGSSLHAALVEHFQPHFALSGMVTCSNVDDHVKESLKRITCSDFMISSLDCLVADTRDWTVRLISCEASTLLCSESSFLPSRLVLDLVENVKTLKMLKVDTDLILVYVEDWLAEIYSKGVALGNLLDDQEVTPSSLMTLSCSSSRLDYLATLIGADLSDVPLIMSVCSVSPHR